MELSLSEAARLLGKSDRQVRYLLQAGKIPAKKKEGHWVIRREDLPLSAGQVQAEQQKTRRAARLAEEILRPDPAVDAKKSHSIRQMRVYRDGVPLYREIESKVGADHPATELMREALMLFACGYHEFDPPAKAELYARARHQTSRAVMALLLDGEDRGDLIDRFERTFLPALGGLIHQAEQRRRSR